MTMKHLSLTDRQAALLKPALERAKNAVLSLAGASGRKASSPAETAKTLMYLAVAEEYQTILAKLNGDPT